MLYPSGFAPLTVKTRLKPLGPLDFRRSLEFCAAMLRAKM
jgi:hypothetical protein